MWQVRGYANFVCPRSQHGRCDPNRDTVLHRLQTSVSDVQAVRCMHLACVCCCVQQRASGCKRVSVFTQYLRTARCVLYYTVPSRKGVNSSPRLIPPVCG